MTDWLNECVLMEVDSDTLLEPNGEEKGFSVERDLYLLNPVQSGQALPADLDEFFLENLLDLDGQKNVGQTQPLGSVEIDTEVANIFAQLSDCETFSELPVCGPKSTQPFVNGELDIETQELMDQLMSDDTPCCDSKAGLQGMEQMQPGKQRNYQKLLWSTTATTCPEMLPMLEQQQHQQQQHQQQHQQQQHQQQHRQQQQQQQQQPQQRPARQSSQRQQSLNCSRQSDWNDDWKNWSNSTAQRSLSNLLKLVGFSDQEPLASSIIDAATAPAGLNSTATGGAISTDEDDDDDEDEEESFGRINHSLFDDEDAFSSGSFCSSAGEGRSRRRPFTPMHCGDWSSGGFGTSELQRQRRQTLVKKRQEAQFLQQMRQLIGQTATKLTRAGAITPKGASSSDAKTAPSKQ